jgi:hypothetical protein
MPITDTLITAAGPRRAITREPAHLTALIWPGDDEYDSARAAWNLHVDQRPACICVAAQVEHVQAAVGYTRANGLRLAAQTTGHLSQTLPPLDRTMLLRLALHEAMSTSTHPPALPASRPARRGAMSSTRFVQIGRQGQRTPNPVA